jgi:hypothetical protein
VAFPVALPSRCCAGRKHRAAQVHTFSRDAPGCRSCMSATTFRAATQWRCRYANMTGLEAPSWPAQKLHQPISGLLGSCGRTGVTSPASSVQLPGRDTCQPDLGSFCTPDRSVTVIDGGRSAGKSRTRGDHVDNEQKHRRCLQNAQPPSLSMSAFDPERTFSASRSEVCSSPIPDVPEGFVRTRKLTLVQLGN